MADPRLQWRQLSQAQPNTSGFIREMRGGINDAVSVAEGMLGRYQEGQEVAGDQELARLLASATNQDELNALVNSDQVKGLNLSKDGIGMLNAAQGRRVDWANTRSVMNDRKGRLGIAQDVNSRAGDLHGVSMADHNWRQNARRESAGLSDEMVAARLEGQQYGTPGVPQGSALDNYLASTIQSESGGNPNAKNPKSSATGLGQFITSTWNQMMAKHPDLGLTADGRTDPAQAKRALRRFTEDNMAFLKSAGIPVTEGTLYQAHFLGTGGANAVAKAPDSAMMRDIMPASVIKANPFLASMTKASFERWAEKKGGGNAPARSRTPARDALQNAVADSKFLSLDQVSKLLEGNDTSVKEGDKEIATELAQRQEDMVAAFITDAAANPDTHTTAQLADAVTEAALKSGEFSDSEVLKARRAAEAILSKSESLQTKLKPNNINDIETDLLIKNTLKDERRQLEGTGIYRAIKDIPLFTKDPTGSLESALGIPHDNETRGDYDSEALRRKLNSLAQEFNVEPAVMAVAMRDAFVRDPGDDGQHWWDVDWTRNTLDRRFDRDRIAETIKQITPDSRALFDQGQANLQIMEQQMAQVSAQRDTLRRTLAKLPADSPRRSSIEAQLLALDGQLAAIQSSRSVRP